MDMFIRDKILQGFQKLSEGEETISAGEHKCWKRSRLKLKRVLMCKPWALFFPKSICALYICISSCVHDNEINSR